MQLHHRLVSILRRVGQGVATLLDKEAINAACREENYSWKNRLFNPANSGPFVHSPDPQPQHPAERSAP